MEPPPPRRRRHRLLEMDAILDAAVEAVDRTGRLTTLRLEGEDRRILGEPLPEAA